MPEKEGDISNSFTKMSTEMREWKKKNENLGRNWGVTDDVTNVTRESIFIPGKAL